MSKVKFWVVIGKVQQMAFDDFGKPTKPHEVDAPVREQHIVVNEMLLCRKSRNVLKKKGEKQSTRLNLFKNIPMCQECEKEFKSREDLGWSKWSKNAESTISTIA